MLAYRSLKILADFWLHATEFLHVTEQKVAHAVDKAVNLGVRLDEKAIDLAHEAHEKLVAAHSAALEKTSTVVDDAEAQGKRIVAEAEAKAVLLVSRARTIEDDAINAYAKGVQEAHKFLDTAKNWHA
jgi:cell division septum initiation protein DivIVA